MDASREQPLVTLTHLIYGLHALSLVAVIFLLAPVMGALLLGCPSLIAVILNYMKRSDVRGTWLESHFRWQIRTFWYGLLWVSVWARGFEATRAVTSIMPHEVGVLLLIMMLAIGMMIVSLPFGILPCAVHQQGEISRAHISDVLTCATVRIVTLWLLYRVARGWLALNHRRRMYAEI